MIALAVVLLAGASIAMLRAREPVADSQAGSDAAPPVPVASADAEPAVRAVMESALAAVRHAPRDHRAWTRLAMVYEAYLLLDPARECYERSLAINDRDPKAWFHLALMRVELGDLTGGIEAMRRSIALEGTYPPSHWRVGFWLLDQGDLEGARQAFARAAQLDPKDAVGALGLARVDLQRGDAAAAAAMLETSLAAAPGSASIPNAAYAWQLLASAYRRLGRFDDAATAMQRGRGGEASFNDAWQYEVAQFRKDKAWAREHARLLAAQGRANEALALIEPLARGNPRDVEILVSLGSAQRQAGRLDESIATLRRAADIDSKREAIQFELALAYYDAGRSASSSPSESRADSRAALITEAIGHLDGALALNPRHVEALALKGQILLQVSRFDDAVAAYRQAAVVDPVNPAWPFRAGLVQLAGGRWEDAVATFEPVTRSWPDFAEAWRGLGVAQMKLGRLDQARTSLQRALKLRPDDPKNQAAIRELETMTSGRRHQ